MAAPICACDTYNKSGYKNMCSTAGDKQVEIYRLQKENAALKKQITNAKYSYLGAMADCKRYEETIEQQAEAIRLKDAALEHVVGMNLSMVTTKLCKAALATQPSPEILQARDKRVAEACAKVCIEQSEGIARSTPVSRDRVHTLVENAMFKGIARPAPVRDCSESSVRESAFRIRNGAWERHL